MLLSALCLAFEPLITDLSIRESEGKKGKRFRNAQPDKLPLGQNKESKERIVATLFFITSRGK